MCEHDDQEMNYNNILMREYPHCHSRECPHCHSHKIESQGFRDSTNIVRRFRCKHCKRSHSRTYDMKLITEVKNMEKLEIYNVDNTNANRANKTLNVTQKTKSRVEMLRTHRDTVDDIINKLIDQYEATKPQ